MAPTFSTPPKKFLTLSMFFIFTIIYQANTQTTLVFYLQDIATGPNATVSPVTGITGKVWSYNTFGTIFVIDDPVMLSPSPSSTIVGRAQGMLVASAHDGANVNVVMSIVFSNLQYSGSTLEIQGISRQFEKYKEVSVVSGTGRFRFARGYATFETAFYDPQTTHSIIRFTITLMQMQP
ncbi:hypothetical protein RJT34_31095 [Clitoria ternatea]|uniref:Dirigent protein n=1 Tax=Clitoria ternatea TaxID=43366 RepID=A0AAN9ETQ4_CLITE